MSWSGTPRKIPGRSRASIRYSKLEDASGLFGGGPNESPRVQVDWRAKLREVQQDKPQDRSSALDCLEGRSRPCMGSAANKTSSSKREPSWLITDEPKAPKEPELDTLPEEPSILESSVSSAGSKTNTPERPAPALPTVSPRILHPTLLPARPPAPVQGRVQTLQHGTVQPPLPSALPPPVQMRPAPGPSSSTPPRPPAPLVRPPKAFVTPPAAPVSAPVMGLEGSRVPQTVPQIGRTPPRGLRPLRLSSGPRVSSGTAKEPPMSPLADRSQKSSLPYRAPPPSAPVFRSGMRGASTPARMHMQRRTNSSNTSHVPSIFGSPHSVTSGSQGETSIESTSPVKPAVLRVLEDKLAATERGVHEMHLQLTSANAERNALVERCNELALELDQLRTTFDDTAAERDMHREDVDGWRHRCSELEHTIQQQQLRLKQEQTWRHAAQRRMEVLTNKVQTSSATSCSGRSKNSSISSVGSFDPDAELASMPPLPTMPSDHEMCDWSLQVARQLSRHTATEEEPDPSPETVRLLSDMRQQIMTLVAELEIERSDHRNTAAQLESARMMPHVRQFSSEASASSASPSTPMADHGEDLWNTPRPPPRSDDAERKSKRRTFAIAPGDHQELQWLSKADQPQWLSEEQASAFTEQREATETGMLSGLGLTPPDTNFNKPLPAEPEVPKAAGLFDESLLHESLDMSTSRRRSSIMSWPAAEPGLDCSGEPDKELGDSPSLAVDLEVAAPVTDEWESEDEEDAPPVRLTDPTKRPEFIPEWCFEQAIFEATREMNAYQTTGRRAGTLARRGHARLCNEPLDDFFGIMDDGKSLPALPVPEHAFGPPPLDAGTMAKLQDRRPSNTTYKATCAAPALAPRPHIVTDTFLDLGEEASSPKPARPSAIAQILSWRPWSTAKDDAEDTDEYETTFGSDYSYEQDPYQAPVQYDSSELGLPAVDMPICRTPPPKEGLLAPAVPAPSTPAQRSPIIGQPSPSSRGRRYLRPNTMTRIPVPTPVYCLDFESTTWAPDAPSAFTI